MNYFNFALSLDQAFMIYSNNRHRIVWYDKCTRVRTVQNIEIKEIENYKESCKPVINK